MTIHTQLVSSGVLVLALVACARRPESGGARLAAPGASAPAAFIAHNRAEFVFPAGAPSRFLPTHEDSVQGYPGQGFIWSVSWDVGGRVGSVPGGIEARGGVPAVVPPGEDTLAAVLAQARPSHTVFCMSCTTPASRLVPEPALSAAVREGRVVLTVRGRDALRRLWPAGAPDSVALFWRGPGPQREATTVPLVRVR